MNYESNTPLRIRTNLADYPVTKALKSGSLAQSLVDFDFCGPKTAHDGFKPMVRENVFDAGELAIVTFLQAHAYKKPYVLLPAPISGRLQHHCIAYNNTRGVLNPKDLEGKRVGVRSYAQTTGLWVRGILRHDYDVNLDKITWLTTDQSHLAEYTDPGNCRQLPKGKKLADMLYDGDIDAAILGNDMPDDPRLSTLIPNAPEEGRKWYEREQIVPINHMFVVRRELSQQRPDIVAEIFRLLVESRAVAATTALLPPFGFEANRKGIEMAIDWSYEQKIIPAKMSVDELFDETTAALVA